MTELIRLDILIRLPYTRTDTPDRVLESYSLDGRAKEQLDERKRVLSLLRTPLNPFVPVKTTGT